MSGDRFDKERQEKIEEEQKQLAVARYTKCVSLFDRCRKPMEYWGDQNSLQYCASLTVKCMQDGTIPEEWRPFVKK